MDGEGMSRPVFQPGSYGGQFTAVPERTAFLAYQPNQPLLSNFLCSGTPVTPIFHHDFWFSALFVMR
jgi:hypothetical protein